MTTPINVTVVGTTNPTSATGTTSTPTTPVAGSSGTAPTPGTGTTGTTAGSGAPAPAVPGGIIAPTATAIIPNPLHKYASYSYAWSLWLLDTDDYNAMIDVGDAGISKNMPLPKSYVIAEDSGLYPLRRLPTQFGLNYNIQSVEFDTVIGPNNKSKHTNIIQGSFVVVEPYGVTLIDSLVLASKKDGVYQNYTQRPFMLQLDFFGYDDAGNQMTTSETAVHRKRFPIRITNVSLRVSKTGAEYTFQFAPMGHGGVSMTIPKQINVTGGRVSEVLDDLAKRLNEHWADETRRGVTHFANSIKFDIDSKIATSEVVYTQQMSLADAKPTGNTVSMTSTTFSIPSGSTIVEALEKILSQSGFIIQQMGLDLQKNGLTISTATAEQKKQSLTQIFNVYKTTCQAKYVGTSGSGAAVSSAFDNARNTFPVEYTFKIHQYPIFDGTHPGLPSLSDSRPYIVKDYKYMYTGKNTDILDFKLEFDTTWFTAVNAYNNQYASSQTSASTGIDSRMAVAPFIMLSPQYLAAAIPALGSIPIINPVRLQPIVHDQRDTQLQIIKDPNKLTAANAMRSVYSRYSGDMIAVTLEIVGDPTLLKQDDWLYSPSPRSSPNFNSSASQKAFSDEHGHIRMDSGTLVVKLTVNSPIDNDIDWANQGLVFPQPGTYTSMFSGLYKIIVIKNIFENGQFRQKIELTRLPNSDLITNSAPDAVSNSDRNQTDTNATVTNQGIR